MGAQESILKAVVADLIPPERRGSAYGIFNTGYGLSWFLGSTVMGIFYDFSLLLLVIFAMIMQLLSVVVLFLLTKTKKQ